jgi:hypothetical protein
MSFDHDENTLVKLGRTTPSKITSGQSGHKTLGFDGEYGLQIYNEGKKFALQEAVLHLRFNTLDSILFRINIYSVKDGLPHERLLSNEVFAKAYKKDHWVKADLSSEKLIMDQNIIVTYQVAEPWFSKKGSNELFFTHGDDYKQGGFFGRRSDSDNWSTQSMDLGVGPVVLYVVAKEMAE